MTNSICTAASSAAHGGTDDRTDGVVDAVANSTITPAASRLGGAARRAIAAIILIVATVVGVVGFGSGAAHAQGMTPGGGWYDASITCSQNGVRTGGFKPSTLQVAVNISAQWGYTNQYVAYRFWTSNGRTSSWSNWQTAWVGPFGSGRNAVFNQTYSVDTYGSYDAYVEILWSNGHSWTESAGFWTDKYQRGFYYPTLSSTCLT
jgi:hypothetical protein